VGKICADGWAGCRGHYSAILQEMRRRRRGGAGENCLILGGKVRGKGGLEKRGREHEMREITLIKKKRKFSSYIRIFRVEQ
jgi:hypothetical protein